MHTEAEIRALLVNVCGKPNRHFGFDDFGNSFNRYPENTTVPHLTILREQLEKINDPAIEKTQEFLENIHSKIVETKADLFASLTALGSYGLFISVYTGSEAMVEHVLKQKDIDANIIYNMHPRYRTPLLQAVNMGYTQIVEMLIADERVDLNKENRWGNTPLKTARDKGHAHIEQLLVNGPAMRRANFVDKFNLFQTLMLSNKLGYKLPKHVMRQLSGNPAYDAPDNNNNNSNRM